MESLIECNDKQGYDDINKLSYKISVNLLAGISENEKVHWYYFCTRILSFFMDVYYA